MKNGLLPNNSYNFQEKLENIKYIFIGNVLETYYRTYHNIPPKERRYWVLHDSVESNRSLLYGGDNKLVLTSIPIKPEYKDYLFKLMDWRNVYNLSPLAPSYSICEDTYRPSKLREIVIKTIKDNPGISIIPYRHTQEFYRLVDFLQREHLKFKLPETIDPKDKFITAYYNTKRGFRHLWSEVFGENKTLSIDIPQGFIVGGKEEAIETGWWFYSHGRSFIIKHNQGVGGVGTQFFHTNKLPATKKAFTQKMQASLSDKLWDDAPLIVEEYIVPDKNILGGSPNVEVLITPQKMVTPSYGGEQLLEKDGKTFCGFYIHPMATNHPLIKTAFEAGVIFGKKLASLGYLGCFDIDLVVCKKTGRLYAVEANLRRTGGTHVHEMSTHLLGKDYSKKYHVLVKDIHLSPRKRIEHSSLFSALRDVLYNKQTKTGVICGNLDMLQVNILHTIYIAPERNKLQALQQKTIQIITGL